MMPRSKFALAILLCAFNSCFASESEDAAYPQSPVAALPKSVTLDAIDIQIKGEQVAVTYLLQNKGVSALSVSYSVYMPMFQWQGAGAEYADRNIPEFAVSINSAPRPVTKANYAFLNGKEITQKLLQANVNTELVASWGQNFKSVSDANANARLKALLNEGVFQTASDVLIPKWHLLSTRTWSMEMDKQSSSTLATHYRARPEFAVVRTDDNLFFANLLAHCGTSGDVVKIKSHSEYAIVKRYVIPVQLAENLSPRIRINFEPKVTSPGASAYMCAGGGNLNTTGAPLFKGELINPNEKLISVLLVSPQ